MSKGKGGKPPTTKARKRKPAEKSVSVTAPASTNMLGSKSEEFRLEMLDQSIRALWLPDWKSEEEQLQTVKAAIAVLRGVDPKSELEGMLATQMVATHNAAMECLRRAMIEKQSFEGRDQNLKHAAKLMSLYERQLAALDKHRGKGQQKITVEHVTVEAGGQAIVGSVTTGQKEGGDRPGEPTAPRNDAAASPKKRPRQDQQKKKSSERRQ